MMDSPAYSQNAFNKLQLYNAHGIIPTINDFTIRHPKTKDFFYWEHFGMMDSPAYSQNAFNKLQLYNAHGIIPTINLITTYETKDQPLNSQYVQHLIEHYFL